MEIENVFLEKIDSTNKWAKEHRGEFNQKNLTVISAKEQTEGKGRFQRKWISPLGENIYATFYFTLHENCMHLSSMAQIMTLSIAKLLIKERLDPKIRWPNDVLLSDKKVAGVLCEMTSNPHGCEVFLGVGINVDTPLDILQRIDKPATSLKEESDRYWEKNQLLTSLQKQFVHDLQLFIKEGFTPFHAGYENLMAYISEEICCEHNEQKWTGICHSLTNEGQLNLYLPNGEIITLSAAEVTLRTTKQESQ